MKAYENELGPFVLCRLMSKVEAEVEEEKNVKFIRHCNTK
jgi:hypothetical protein